MTKGDKTFLGLAVGAFALATIVGIKLQPEQPNFGRNGRYQEEPASYLAGGTECEQAKIQSLPSRKRQSKADACAQAEEQHREVANGLIDSRRSAIATEASAIYTAIQARIEALGLAYGLLTLLAAVAAAFFAKKAADHTEESTSVAREASRAWVVCEDVVVLEPVTFVQHEARGQLYEMSFDVLLKNTGQGLARRVFVFAETVSMETSFFEPALAMLESASKQRIEEHYSGALYRGLPIAPGQTVAVRHGDAGPSEGGPTLEEIEGGSFFILGYVSYLDHFGREQSSVFAFHPDADSLRPWDNQTLVRSGAIGDAT